MLFQVPRELVKHRGSRLCSSPLKRTRYASCLDGLSLDPSGDGERGKKRKIQKVENAYGLDDERETLFHRENENNKETQPEAFVAPQGGNPVTCSRLDEAEKSWPTCHTQHLVPVVLREASYCLRITPAAPPRWGGGFATLPVNDEVLREPA